MTDIKDEVKARSDIVQVVGEHVRLKKTGDYYMGPCCFHKDSDPSLSVRPNERTWKCFGCDRGGDVIDFVMAIRGCDFQEALKDLAARFGIDMPGNGGGRQSKPKAPPDGEPPPPAWELPKPEGPGLDPDRASDIRRMACNYWHQQLIRDPDAWSYQTTVRQHRPEILERARVGLARGNVIKYLRGQGVTDGELLGIGLGLKRGFGISSAVDTRVGFYMYPHQSRGRTLFITRKDPKKEKKYQFKRRYADPAWICYGQDALDQHEPVLIVEGEDDRITCVDLGRYEHTMATCGNSNTSRIRAELRARARNRTFYLCFDDDKAGRGYVLKFASAVTEGGGIALAVPIPGGSGETKRDIDDVLREAADAPAELRGLMAEARPWQPDARPAAGEGAAAGGSSVWAQDAPPPVYDFSDDFEVLGELEDGAILFWSKRPKLYRVQLEKFTLEKLIQIGGSSVAERVARSSKDMKEGQTLFSPLRKWLIIQAAKQQLWEPDFLTNGIHVLRPDKELLVVNGGEAFRWDGAALETQTYPVVGGKIVRARPGREWVDMAQVARLLEDMRGAPDGGRAAAMQIQDRFGSLFSQWGFAGRLDWLLLTGWHLAQWLQTVWPWRPHLWLIGKAGTGKTLLHLLLYQVIGPLVIPCQGQTLTEPGLRQQIGTGAGLVLIDEMEKSVHRDEILHYIRSAGRGGFTFKGSPDQQGIKAYIRHMIFLSSVEMWFEREAEYTRYLIMETVKDNSRKPRFPTLDEAARLRVEAVAYALWAFLRAREAMENTPPPETVDARLWDSVCVPFSMIAAAYENPAGTLDSLGREYLSTSKDRGTGADDEEVLLQTILMSSIRLPMESEDSIMDNKGPRYVTRTVSQLLDDYESMSADIRHELEAHGVKVIGEALWIMPDKVRTALLRGTGWAKSDIRDLLLRLGTPENPCIWHQARIGRSRMRGVLIPWQYVIGAAGAAETTNTS